MRHLLIVGVGGLMLMASGCARGPEPEPRQALGELPAQSFARHWRAELDLNGDRLRELHVRGDLVFVYTDRRVSYGLSRESGRVVHAAQIARGRRWGAPVLLDERVVYPTDTSVEVFDERGRLVRSIAMEYPLRSDAVGSGVMLYVGADVGGSGRVLAIDVERPYGVVRWELMMYGAIRGAPALHDGVIYAGSDDGQVNAFTPARAPAWRQLSWSRFETDGPIMADIKADDSGVYVASMDSKLYSLDRRTGRIQWQYYAGAALDASPEVTGTTVYQMVPGQGLAALDKQTGGYNREPRWIAPDAVQFLAEDDQHSYVRRRDNVIVALDRSTGEVRFESERSDFALFGTNTQDSIIFAARRDGRVMAITPVLRPGRVGELVLESRPVESARESIAMSN